MNILKIYQNFFLRNVILIIVFLSVIFSCVYNDFYSQIHKVHIGWFKLLFTICIGIFPFYIAIIFSNMVLIKELFLKKKYASFIVMFILFWCSFYFIVCYYFDYFDLGKFTALKLVTVASNGTGIYFIHLWILRNISKGQKDILNFEAELSFLKQQLNPHFLLNAMNNLYGESLSEPENVPDRILNLADMLRYQIEATKKNLVPLNEEVNFIKRYVEYYTFRNEKLEVNQSFEGAIDAIEIPPLFFLPLVENAVKFSGEVPLPIIKMHLNINKRKLSFSLQNNFLVSGSRLTGTGIGIENLKRRLEVYGLKHELIATKQDNMYTIKLNIWELPTAAL
ncbi:histidine kinase [Flavobacterium rivuli WB 3.3-2 = DSM 21788]|uniref:Histidine kinase n=2 Tax=Flavobacterium rivuli TaxID=498301 RepID=A0A0A2M3N8_9FLAO|nr:histidine kinase [Flavobacterium rivuli WB 3.3-2 = DSM 21788]